MFFIASAGRSGTLALTHGLDAFSDHEVAHEPDPLLEESWSKHRGLTYRGRRLDQRLALYARRHATGERYGESVRTPNLLPELLAAAPGAPLLVIVREPSQWVRSAHGRRVLQKGDVWDRYRLMPENDHREHSLARRLAAHWCTVNGYMLSMAERYRPAALVLHQPISPVVAEWALFLGVALRAYDELDGFLATRPNRSVPCEDPEGMEEVEPLCRELWDLARELAAHRTPTAAGSYR